MKTSRTYKLRLSAEGINLFLECHYRAARILRDFIPYGLTLSIAVAVLEQQELDDVAAEFAGPRCKTCLGAHIRYVGASSITARTVVRICERLVECNECAVPPKAIKMYVVALLSLSVAEDHEIVEAFGRVKAIDQAAYAD